jgi:glycosyltransferase involved in cell wall biosynthesis
MNNKMFISIIVCTHNRASVLKAALQSLKKVKIPEGFAVELILADNASSDGTSLLIETFRKETDKFQIQHMYEENLGKSFALNKGIRAAAGDWLAFIDDDHIVSDSYLIEVCSAIKHHKNYGIFCGRVLPNWDGSEPQWVHDDNRYPIRPYPIPRFDLGEKALEIKEDKNFLPGSGNLVVKKEVFERVGIFSQELGPKGHNLNGGEDIEFVRRALKKGEGILYVPHIVQNHQVFSENLRLPYIVRKAYLRSIAAYRFSGEHLSGNNKHGIPGYLLRQAITRLLKAAVSLNPNARRYYLVRFAATLGEINGRKKASTSLPQQRSG